MVRKKNAPVLDALTRSESLPTDEPLPPDGSLDASEALDLGAEHSEDHPEDRSGERVRKPKTVDTATASLFPDDTVDLPERVHAATRAWRDANDREVPSIDRLLGTVERVDVDALSGYVAVVTAEDTWRTFLPREQLIVTVALLVRRPVDEVARIVAEGPGPVTAASRT